MSLNFTHAAELVRPKVPSTLQFAGMQLKLTDGARKEIQKEVDALTKSATYYNIKADRIKLYFPIIEKTLEENGVPGDFKYLAVQESALISDAVSSAKAVGFWQFKDFTGREVGLRIDKRIDERLNVVASTKGAAKYFTRNNFYFKNWVYAILAHMTGRGGAAKYVDKKLFGAKKMTIDRHTHWYVRRFLAHMIAFRDADKGSHSEGIIMDVFWKAGGMSIKEIAKKTKSDELVLKKYNKWLKSGSVPTDKPYAILIPKKGTKSNFKGSNTVTPIAAGTRERSKPSKATSSLVEDPKRSNTIFIKINGLPCILAREGDTMESLSEKGEIHMDKFAKYNDLAKNAKIKEGQIYYLKKKRNRAKSYFHTVQRGESLWDVSQKFGIKRAKLAKLNRMSIIDELQPGRVLWLKNRRPEQHAVEIKDLPMLPVDEAIPLKEIVKQHEKDDKLKIDTVRVDEHHEKIIVAEETDTNVKIKLVEHTVQKGESLYAISKQFGVSVSDIMEWNSLVQTSLSIGQVLKIHGERRISDPNPVELKKNEKNIKKELEPEKVLFHVVAPGDTMYGVSRRYGVSVNDLLRMNQKDNFDLAIGEKLILRE
ncbi:LysM peptidoglycan-binding domain-containing protein [Reichenbachiella versicolor]|uniref:LysM peptidoglycan-binding domain-containing protein n=1 Tax=Reichenbachiella versicolor TaxID=1821036 RepID=UPI0013A55227|nr:LysM peptidoglycan-binding domain-containing protein [Reichenbachiella versicolor]